MEHWVKHPQCNWSAGLSCKAMSESNCTLKKTKNQKEWEKKQNKKNKTKFVSEKYTEDKIGGCQDKSKNRMI